MPFNERELRSLLANEQARLIDAEEISFPREQIAVGLQAAPGDFAEWLDKGAPGAALQVRSAFLSRLSIDLHRYPKVHVLEVMDREGRAIEVRPLRGKPDVGLVGEAGNLAYVRNNADGDAAGIRVGEHWIVLRQQGTMLQVALLREQAALPQPPDADLLTWCDSARDPALQTRVTALVRTGKAWDAVVGAALLAHRGGIGKPPRPITSFEDLELVQLVESRPVEWVRSVDTVALGVLGAEVDRKVADLRTRLDALRARDDKHSDDWTDEYADCAWNRAAIEVVKWLVTRRPEATISHDALRSLDRLGEATRPVLEELIRRDPIVAAVAATDPGCWWDAGSLPDDVA